MNPIPTLWYAMAVLLVSNAITGVLWRSTAHDLAILELKGEVAAEQAKAAVKEQKQITEDTTNGWKAALDSSRTDWAQRLRLAGVRAVPPVSGPPGGVDGLAPDALALAPQCAETTLAYEKLQAWAKMQRDASRKQ